MDKGLRSAIVITFLGLVTFLFQGCAGHRKPSDDGVLSSISDEEIKPLVFKEFVLGYGDVIEITVLMQDSLNRNILVGPSGMISYPFAGEFMAVGLTIHQLRDKVTKAISENYRDPVVTVNIISNQSQKVFVLGEVKRPGVFLMSGPMFATEAISMAGGFTLDSNEQNVFLIRRDNTNNPEPKLLNLMATLEEGEVNQDLNIRPGDVLYVPPTTIASVDRYFKRIYNIILPLVTLEHAIALEPLAEEAITGKAQKADKEGTIDLNLNLLR